MHPARSHLVCANPRPLPAPPPRMTPRPDYVQRYQLACRSMESSQDVPMAEGKISRGKVGRPIMDEGNPFSPDVTPEQRRVRLRRVVNRDSARRVRDRRNEDINRLVQKADSLETENALLRQELNDAQAIETQLKGRLAQVQKDIAAMVHNNAGMRTTVEGLRQRGAPLQSPHSSNGNLLPIPSSFNYSIEFPVQPDAPHSIEGNAEWLGCWDTLIEDLSLESVSAAPSKGQNSFH